MNRTERDIMEIRGHRGGVRSYVPVEVALTTVNCWVETGFGSRRASDMIGRFRNSYWR